MGKTQNDMRKMHHHYFTIIIMKTIASFRSSLLLLNIRPEKYMSIKESIFQNPYCVNEFRADLTL